MKIRPNYIPESIVGTPIDFPWLGDREHIGPTQTVTPLLEMLGDKTTCAHLSLGAGILQWACWRLAGHAEVDRELDFVEAIFAYQVDPRYLKESARSGDKPFDDTPASKALKEIDWLMVKATNPERYWHSYYNPIMEVFHSAHVVRHILSSSARKTFGDWLKAISKRLDEVAPKPDEPFRKLKTFATLEEYHAFTARHRGVPLPIQLLDPDFDYRPEQRETLIDAYLSRLDWKSNHYLNSPDEMRALGFEGIPYRLG